MPNLKQTALQIFRQTLAGIDIPQVMCDKLERAGSRVNVCGSTLDLASFERIYTVAIGKASAAMAFGLAELLAPDFTAEGIVVGPVLPRRVPDGCRAMLGAHPVPDAGSFAAARAILELLRNADERTLV